LSLKKMSSFFRMGVLGILKSVLLFGCSVRWQGMNYICQMTWYHRSIGQPWPRGWCGEPPALSVTYGMTWAPISGHGGCAGANVFKRQVSVRWDTCAG